MSTEQHAEFQAAASKRFTEEQQPEGRKKLRKATKAAEAQNATRPGIWWVESQPDIAKAEETQAEVAKVEKEKTPEDDFLPSELSKKMPERKMPDVLTTDLGNHKKMKTPMTPPIPMRSTGDFESLEKEDIEEARPRAVSQKCLQTSATHPSRHLTPATWRGYKGPEDRRGEARWMVSTRTLPSPWSENCCFTQPLVQLGPRFTDSALSLVTGAQTLRRVKTRKKKKKKKTDPAEGETCTRSKERASSPTQRPRCLPHAASCAYCGGSRQWQTHRRTWAKAPRQCSMVGLSCCQETLFLQKERLACSWWLFLGKRKLRGISCSGASAHRSDCSRNPETKCAQGQPMSHGAAGENLRVLLGSVSGSRMPLFCSSACNARSQAARCAKGVNVQLQARQWPCPAAAEERQCSQNWSAARRQQS